MRFRIIAPVFVLFAVTTPFIFAQSPNGNINGLVSDPSKATVAGAQITAVNDVTGVQYSTITNHEGIYVLPSLPPGPYRLQVSKVGFKTVIKPDIMLKVQDALSLNFTLPVGATFEILTVQGGVPLVNTESAAVSTVVDQQFADNLPMNGRSFQTLIQLTPGVVLTASNYADNGQFSVNGQRGTSNYWMVDGVSANIGIGPKSGAGNGLAGAVGSFSALGGTNSLVSVDALQEFRIQTSTFAPEFGRTPGAQISILTRSGTNQWHGTAFDYLRNDKLDANDWFANLIGQPRAKERQNDFGGTVSGPILKDRTFFFFSYEGLRLRLPQTTLSTVPDLTARQSALAAVQPYLDAFPLPNGPDDLSNSTATFDASYSNPAGLDAFSLRIDHRVNNKLIVFGRSNYAPSSIEQRGSSIRPLSVINKTDVLTETTTLGASFYISPIIANDLRFNYSSTNARSNSSLDDFGGAVPLSTNPFPTPYDPRSASFAFGIFSLQNGFLNFGHGGKNTQRQINLTESLSVQRGAHAFKVGIDFRRLTPTYSPQVYTQEVLFDDVPSAEKGTFSFTYLASAAGSSFGFKNLGLYGQDTWRATQRLTLTYGLRWDVDFVPTGSKLAAVIGFNPDDLTNLLLAPAGTPPFSTQFSSVAPRVGLAYQLRQSQDFQTVIRGGGGVFYDLATSEIGNSLAFGYPFSGSVYNFLGGSFPLSPAAAAPPPILAPNATDPPAFNFLDPKLKPPHTLEWSLALEQALGPEQTISSTYIGSIGRHLLQTGAAVSPNPTISFAEYVTNGATSNYNALQVQFQRRLLRGLQALASYAWSHSIDTGSAGSLLLASNALVPFNGNRASSDFDIRHALSAAVTFDIPVPKANRLTDAMIRGWSCEHFIMARSAPPVDVSDGHFFEFDRFAGDTRPDILQGQPLYLFGTAYPGGKAFNPDAFADPPTDPLTGNPVRQGTAPRNLLRGFGAVQWDVAVHRDFPIHESLKVQFRAEMFNVLNHPNFGSPNAQFGTGGFGLSTQMLGQYLNGGSSGSSNLGGGAFSPLYQVGGPRSIQLALKFSF